MPNRMEPCVSNAVLIRADLARKEPCGILAMQVCPIYTAVQLRTKNAKSRSVNSQTVVDTHRNLSHVYTQL